MSEQIRMSWPREKNIPGEEVAYRTLMRERVEEPCILASWCMKREFFSKLSGERDIYRDAAATVVRAFLNAGANLCPQFIMPSSGTEHLAVDPRSVNKNNTKKDCEKNRQFAGPEDVKEDIEKLPPPDTLEKEFDLDLCAREYAASLLDLRELAGGEMLFIGDFGQADFMGGYNRWGYDNYLLATALYPDVIKHYYDYTGEIGRLYNLAIAGAVGNYDLAPFVYSGQDICFNDGPIVSLQFLSDMYFPALKKAARPLHDAGIKIIWHCDGDVRPIANVLLAEVGVEGFQGFQEETGCTLKHMASLQTRKGEKPLLWGSVSVTSTLPFGTVEDVRKDVERCFDTAGKTGYALAASSSILPETPFENIIALYEHGQEYGKNFG